MFVFSWSLDSLFTASLIQYFADQKDREGTVFHCLHDHGVNIKNAQTENDCFAIYLLLNGPDAHLPVCVYRSATT